MAARYFSHTDNTLWGIKKTLKFIDRKFKMDYQILIIFCMNISYEWPWIWMWKFEWIWIWMAIYVNTSPSVCFCTTWGKQTKQNITFSINAASLCDTNNLHLAHFVHISSTLADSLSNCPVVQLLTINIWNISHLCKHRHAYALSIHWEHIGNDLLQSSTSCFFYSSLIFLNSIP